MNSEELSTLNMLQLGMLNDKITKLESEIKEIKGRLTNLELSHREEALMVDTYSKCYHVMSDMVKDAIHRVEDVEEKLSE